jgi:hypothetical protein
MRLHTRRSGSDTAPHDGTVHEDLRGRGRRLEPAHLTIRSLPHPIG